MMVGTPDENKFKELDPSEMPDVFNDFDLDYMVQEEEIQSSIESEKALGRIIEKVQ